jgi:hypothetical protein
VTLEGIGEWARAVTRWSPERRIGELLLLECLVDERPELGRAAVLFELVEGLGEEYDFDEEAIEAVRQSFEA